MRQALLRLAALGRAEDAEHVFGRDQLVAFLLNDGAIVGHRSRQSLSFSKPRRIQLFMVPSGTFMRSASSS